MSNKPFSPVFTLTNRIAAALTRIERARGFLDAATLSEDWDRDREAEVRPSDSVARAGEMQGVIAIGSRIAVLKGLNVFRAKREA